MKPRVLVLTTEWPTARDPVNGVFVREFAAAAALVADISVVAIERERSRRFYDVDVERGDSDISVRVVRYRRFRKPLSVLAFVLGARAAVRASGGRFDVVHTHSFLATVLASLLLPRTPIVFTEHWSIFLPDDPGELRPSMNVLARIALRRARVVLPPSRALAAALAELAPQSSFRVIPNVVDVSLFAPPAQRTRNTRPQLVGVGMMTEDRSKGIDFLLRAVHLLDGVDLHLAGGGPRRPEYEALAHELGIADRVTFHGVLPKQEVAALLRRCDLFVLASRFDNNPCALIEAHASGLPVVATRVGGVPELVDDGSGVLVAPQDPKALAAGIEDALGRLAQFDPDAIAARARERYGREHVAAQLAAVYEEAISESS